MPIWLRKFTFQKMNDYYEEQNKKNKTASTTPQNMPKGPNIKKPSYSTKARP